MKVVLLDHTGEPERTVAAAARLCYSSSTPRELKEKLTDDEVARLIRMIRNLGHLSVFEHASFSFGIEGISRVTSHQLVRHRLASYSQQSQRYVDLRQGAEFIVPDSIREAGLEKEALELIERAKEFYERAVQKNVPVEDARYFFPQGVATNIVVTMNARELHHFFQLRLCRRAQWEIRKMAALMLKRVLEVAPVLFEKAGPSCFNRGRCSEGKMTCGRPVKQINEIFEELGIA